MVSLPESYTTCNDRDNIYNATPKCKHASMVYHPSYNMSELGLMTVIQPYRMSQNTSHDHNLKIHEYHNTKVHNMAITPHTRASPQPPSHPAVDLHT